MRKISALVLGLSCTFGSCVNSKIEEENKRLRSPEIIVYPSGNISLGIYSLEPDALEIMKERGIYSFDEFPQIDKNKNLVLTEIEVRNYLRSR